MYPYVYLLKLFSSITLFFCHISFVLLLVLGHEYINYQLIAKSTVYVESYKWGLQKFLIIIENEHKQMGNRSTERVTNKPFSKICVCSQDMIKKLFFYWNKTMVYLHVKGSLPYFAKYCTSNVSSPLLQVCFARVKNPWRITFRASALRS